MTFLGILIDFCEFWLLFAHFEDFAVVHDIWRILTTLCEFDNFLRMLTDFVNFGECWLLFVNMVDFLTNLDDFEDFLWSLITFCQIWRLLATFDGFWRLWTNFHACEFWPLVGNCHDFLRHLTTVCKFWRFVFRTLMTFLVVWLNLWIVSNRARCELQSWEFVYPHQNYHL